MNMKRFCHYGRDFSFYDFRRRVKNISYYEKLIIGGNIMKLLKNAMYRACLACWAMMIFGAVCFLKAGFIATGIIVLIAGLVQMGVTTWAVITS